VHIPYKGGAAMLQALLNDEVQVLFGEMTTALPWIQSGRLTPLAIVSNKRSPAVAGRADTDGRKGYRCAG
jgi:tripartite-type tricarboxylate transporter receptor subunit TctC